MLQAVVFKRTDKLMLRFVAKSSDNNHVNSAAQNVLFAVLSNWVDSCCVIDHLNIYESKDSFDLLHSIVVAASQGR